MAATSIQSSIVKRVPAQTARDRWHLSRCTGHRLGRFSSRSAGGHCGDSGASESNAPGSTLCSRLMEAGGGGGGGGCRSRRGCHDYHTSAERGDSPKPITSRTSRGGERESHVFLVCLIPLFPREWKTKLLKYISVSHTCSFIKQNMGFILN